LNTFLPYSDFAQSARCLDRARLGKQRVEVLQIARVLAGLSDGWRNHPAVRMWEGHGSSLCEYGVAVCEEWLRRGYADNCLLPIDVLGCTLGGCPPPWLGDPAFHASHRSNLLRKNLMHYRQFSWTEHPFLPYVWPRSELELARK
jgi:hypothetical protein